MKLSNICLLLNLPQLKSTLYLILAYPGEVFVVGGLLQVELVLVLLGETLQHAVEDVIVSLVWILMNNPRLLQQILIYLGSLNDSTLVEVDVDVFSES